MRVLLDLIIGRMYTLDTRRDYNVTIDGCLSLKCYEAMTEQRLSRLTEQNWVRDQDWLLVTGWHSPNSDWLSTELNSELNCELNWELSTMRAVFTWGKWITFWVWDDEMTNEVLGNEVKKTMRPRYFSQWPGREDSERTQVFFPKEWKWVWNSLEM